MAKRWYSVSVLSNFEKKIAEAIRTKAEEKGLADQIDDVLEKVSFQKTFYFL
jgi:transcriptional antiterminator NusG